jgi:hypothetical protein
MHSYYGLMKHETLLIFSSAANKHTTVKNPKLQMNNILQIEFVKSRI